MLASSCREERTLSIREIRDDIERRALERQSKIQRGEIDVPIHYFPVSVTTLYDRLSQLDYRTDFLSLAVPPRERSLLGRCKVGLKALVCRCLRWLLIRQVEFNTVALDHAMESARQLASADQNIGELYAAVKAMKLQVHTLSQRISQLEDERGIRAEDSGGSTVEPSGNHEVPLTADDGEKHRAFLGYFADRGPVLNIGCGRGEFLKTFLSEGFIVEGIDNDRERVDYCQDHELPVQCDEALDYLGRIEDGFLGGIYLDHAFDGLTPREIGSLLSLCWLKLHKGGVLLAETSNPACLIGGLRRPPVIGEDGVPVSVDLLSYLVENHCFWIIDQLFSGPVVCGLPAFVQSSKGCAYDMKQYRDYALIGRK